MTIMSKRQLTCSYIVHVYTENVVNNDFDIMKSRSRLARGFNPLNAG